MAEKDAFNISVEAFTMLVRDMIAKKNADYAGGDPNPFAAFDSAAQELGLTREQVWSVFFHKHIRALNRWVAEGKLSSEDIKSRLLDIAAYAAILYASITEKEVDEAQD